MADFDRSFILQQQIVIRISTKDRKFKSKVMQIAVGVSGVEKAAWPEKDLIEVTGDGVDAVDLVRMLRKRIGFAELVRVSPAAEKKEESPKAQRSQPIGEMLYWPYCPAAPPHFYHQKDRNSYYSNSSSCSIVGFRTTLFCSTNSDGPTNYYDDPPSQPSIAELKNSSKIIKNIFSPIKI